MKGAVVNNFADLMKITSIKQQEKLTDRYSVFVDGKYSFSLSEGALLDSKLASGRELTEGELDGFKQLSADDKLYGNALRYAAMRLRSEWELRSYLQRKQASPEAAEIVIGKLRRIGFVDDAAFAQAWVDNRRAVKPSSKRKLQQELKLKRVSDDLIQQVLSDGVDDERAALQNMIIRMRRQSKYCDDETKLMQYLVRQGFSYDDVKNAVRQGDED